MGFVMRVSIIRFGGMLLLFSILLMSSVSACSSPVLEGINQIPAFHYKGGVLSPTRTSAEMQIYIFFHAHPNHAPAATCP